MRDPVDRPSDGGNHGRRRFLRDLAGAGAASTVGLAGCSTLFNGDLDTRAGAASGGPVPIEYVDVAGVRGKEHFAPAVRAVEEVHDVEVDLTYTEVPYENIKRTLLTRLGGGNAPDIAAIDQIWLGEFIAGGVLMTLDGVADDVGFDDVIDGFAEAVQADGHVYGFPISTDVRGMYWNKSMFEDAGLDPEAPPATWPELVDVATQLHDPPGTYGSTYFVNAGRWTVNLFSSGGRVLSADRTEPRFHEPPGVEAADLLYRLYNEAEATPPQPVFNDGAQMAREFLTGQYAIDVVEGSWLDFFWRNLGNETPAMLDRFGFAPTPHAPGGEPATTSGGHVWAGFSDTDHPRIVRAFLREVNRPSFLERLMVETGDVPTRRSLLSVGEIWDQMAYGDTVREMVQYADLRPVKNWSVVAEALDPALQRVALGREEPRAALEAAARAVRDGLR